MGDSPGVDGFTEDKILLDLDDSGVLLLSNRLAATPDNNVMPSIKQRLEQTWIPLDLDPLKLPENTKM